MKRLMNSHPSFPLKVFLGSIPFIITIIIYMWASDIRLEANPDDKLMPSMSKMSEAIDRIAFQPSKRSGEYLMLTDTLASLERLGIGIFISAIIGLVFGVLNGAIPFVRAKLSPYVTAISLVPPLAILPILFIVFGLGEVSKIMLIVIGVTPFLIRDMQAKTLELPFEQLIKAQTIGANTWQVIVRVILPQIMPRLLASVRLSLGTAWLFLIAAEAIASTEGLGYRIFLVRRYLSMDVILPYVIWIAFLAFLLDWLIRKYSEKRYPWFHTQS